MIVVFASPTFCTQTNRWGSAGKSRVGCVGIMFGFEVIDSLGPDRTHLKSSRPSARHPVTAPIQAAHSVAFTDEYYRSNVNCPAPVERAADQPSSIDHAYPMVEPVDVV